MGTSFNENWSGPSARYAVIAIERRNQPASVGVAVDCRHSRPRIREQTQVRSAVSVEPSVDLLERAAREQRKVMVKVETRCEHRTRSGQDDRAIAEFGFETVECCMEIGEEGWILCVDLIGVHGHHSHMGVLALDGPRHRTILQYSGVAFSERPKVRQA